MFKDEFEFLQDLLSEGHKLVTKSILFFGFFLVILSGLIFIFPAIIGTLFAIFILLAGLVALVTGYQLWQTKANKSYNLNPFYTECNFIKPRYNRPPLLSFSKHSFYKVVSCVI